MWVLAPRQLDRGRSIMRERNFVIPIANQLRQHHGCVDIVVDN
jgi:hypothetical protein